MRICWFDDWRLGVVRGGLVHDVTDVLAGVQPRYPFPKGDPLIAALDELRTRLEAMADEAATTPVEQAWFLPPVVLPTKIMGTPANYWKHIEEAEKDPEIVAPANVRKVEEQGLFLKANSSLVGPSEGVRVALPDRRTDHEAELGVVIGREAANVSEDEALDCVAGYAIALDMSVRGPEDRSFRKSPDSYAVLGPWLVTADEIDDPDALDFSLSVDGTVRQKSNTRHMILSTRKQIAWASSMYTLYPGDILMTGTCEGVGPVEPGQTMHCEIEKIGAMDVPVRGSP